MGQVVLDPETIDFVRLEDEFAIPCELMVPSGQKGAIHAFSGGGNSPAEWAIYYKCPKCGMTRSATLICDPCKEFVTHTEDAVQCGRCDAIFAPYRKMLAPRIHRIS
jgi:uncharacterized C2H2 Zn-finger protein